MRNVAPSRRIRWSRWAVPGLALWFFWGTPVADDFVVRARVTGEPLPYMPQNVVWEIENTGRTRDMRVGADRVDTHVFIRVRHEAKDGDPVRDLEWLDTTVPQAAQEPAPVEPFESGGRRTGSETIHWQPERPMLDRPGRWSVRVIWRGPDGEVESEPVVVVLDVPRGRDAELLKRLGEAGGLTWLYPRFDRIPDPDSGPVRDLLKVMLEETSGKRDGEAQDDGAVARWLEHRAGGEAPPEASRN